MVPNVGFELTTYCLQDSCSTTELIRHKTKKHSIKMICFLVKCLVKNYCFLTAGATGALATGALALVGFAATGAEQEPFEQELFLPKIPSTETDETATTVASKNENINHPP